MKFNELKIQESIHSFMRHLMTCPNCNILRMPIPLEKLKKEGISLDNDSIFLLCIRCGKSDIIEARKKVL
jgi:translation initiation factor 2 beta subunit (eIF-2beta)/eIF-5